MAEPDSITPGGTTSGATGAEITVVLRGDDTARVRLPTAAECGALGIGPDTPVWVIVRGDGDAEIYPGDSTVIVPA